MWPYWILIAGICFVIEIYTVGFFIFWFGIGAIFALISSFITDNLIIQLVVFVMSSVFLLLLTKPLLKRISKNTKTVPTNVYSLVGKNGIVVSKIDSINSSGQVKVNGEIWSATSDLDLEKDTKIKVIGINGVKLKVEKI